MQSKGLNLKGVIRNILENTGMLVIFVVLFISLSIFVPYFFTWRNMVGLALSVSMVGMVACTMLFCLASGDFDLSVESVVAFSGVFTATVIKATGDVVLGILCGILAGSLVGLFNGYVITKLKINALITTLATMQIVRGLGFIISGGRAVGITATNFFFLGTGKFLAVPTPVWITIICFIMFGFLLNRTTFGRNTLAMGGNREAARLAGVPIDKIKIIIFGTTS